MQRIILLCLIILKASPQFASPFKLSQSYNLTFVPTISTLALASHPVQSDYGVLVDIAFGAMSGSVFVWSINIPYAYQHHLFNKAIGWMDWNQNLIFASTQDTIIVSHVRMFTQYLNLSTQNIIRNVAFRFQNNSVSDHKVLIAISFDNRMEIFENTSSIMNQSLLGSCSAMSFDLSGNYFYYFNSYTRYILDVKERRVLNSSYFNQSQSCMAVSRQQNFTIYATVSQNGSILVWQHENQRADLNPLGTVRKLFFTQSNIFLVAMHNNSMQFWEPSDHVWQKSELFQITAYRDADCKNNKIVTLSLAGNQITIYDRDYGHHSYTVVIVVSVCSGVALVVLIVIGVVAYRRCRAKKLKQDSYLRFESMNDDIGTMALTEDNKSQNQNKILSEAPK